MKVYYLDFKRKILNRIKLLSSLLILLSLPVIAIAMISESENEYYYLLFAFGFFVIYLLISILNYLLRSNIEINSPSEYILSLNADVPLKKIKGKGYLGYSKNYLTEIKSEPKRIVELDRNQANKLITSKKFDESNVEIRPQKLGFLELNPNGVMEFVLYLTSA